MPSPTPAGPSSSEGSETPSPERQSSSIHTPPFLRAFLDGATPSGPLPKTEPLPDCVFPLLKRAVLRSQKEGVLGKKIAWEGWHRQGRKKGCTKKVGIPLFVFYRCLMQNRPSEREIWCSLLLLFVPTWCVCVSLCASLEPQGRDVPTPVHGP